MTWRFDGVSVSCTCTASEQKIEEFALSMTLEEAPEYQPVSAEGRLWCLDGEAADRCAAWLIEASLSVIL